MQTPPGVDPRAYVIRRLDQAGETLMCLPGRGCFPAGIRSSMPDYIQTPGGDAHRVDPQRSAQEAERLRPTPPSSREISLMDEVYLRWIPLLPNRTDLELRARRLVLLRSLVWPVSDRLDPHVWSWRRLGEEFHLDGHTVKARHERAVDLLTRRLTMPAPCAGTLQRIFGAQKMAPG